MGGCVGGWVWVGGCGGVGVGGWVGVVVGGAVCCIFLLLNFLYNFKKKALSFSSSLNSNIMETIRADLRINNFQFPALCWGAPAGTYCACSTYLSRFNFCQLAQICCFLNYCCLLISLSIDIDGSTRGRRDVSLFQNVSTKCIFNCL